MISSRLDAYVAAEEATESAAGNGNPANVWGSPVISEHSPPVRDGNAFFAVAAFSFDPGGHPVQVLSYADRKWSPVAALAAPTSPGTIYHAGALDLFSENTPIAVAEVTGTSPADFLVKFAGGGCFSGAIVSRAGTRSDWRYVPFTGPFPTSDVLGGNPQFEGTTVVSHNDCTATAIPVGERHSWTWTYDSSSGTLAGVEKPGWPPNLHG